MENLAPGAKLREAQGPKGCGLHSSLHGSTEGLRYDYLSPLVSGLRAASGGRVVAGSSYILFPGTVLCVAYKMQRSVAFLLTFAHLVLLLFSSSLDLMDWLWIAPWEGSTLSVWASCFSRARWSPSRTGRVYVFGIMYALFLSRRTFVLSVM